MKEISKKILLFSLLFLLPLLIIASTKVIKRIFVFAFPDCVDTDGGIKIDIQGSCTDSCGGPYTDYCPYFPRGHVVEYYCSGDKCDDTWRECPNGECCSDGICNGVTGTCSDTDGGIDKFTKGTCTDSCGGPYTDACSSDKQEVWEYYCTDDKHCRRAYITCGSGYVCENGKCVATSTFCSDTDNGKDTSTKGTCTDAGGSYTDSCSIGYNNIGVVEYYCSGDKCDYTFLECPNGECCSDGKCNGIEGTCSDTDEGIVSDIQGTCTDSCGNFFTDECLWNNLGVIEHWCTPYKHCVKTIAYCPPGSCCKNGACSPTYCTCTPGETQSCGNCGVRTCQADGTWGPCQADSSKCSGNCAVCKTTDGGNTYNCAADNTKCSNTVSSCYCSGSGTTFNCVACPSGYTCSSYTCVQTCTDECSPSGKEEYRCSGNTVQKRTCGNYDADSCLEWSSWSNVVNCDSYDTACRDYYCSNGSCRYTNKSAGTSCGTCRQCDGSGNCVGITAADGPNCTGTCTQCVSGNCVPDPAHCSNNIQDCDETGVDCGGQDCSPCNSPPTATNLSVDPPNPSDYCGITGYPPVRLNWQFSDPDSGDSQYAYQIQVDDNSNFSSPLLDTGKVISSSQSFLIQPPYSTLSWNSTYYWRLRVWDNHDTPSSNWIVYQNNFSTPIHPYPNPKFKWIPQRPSVGEVVQFCSVSTGTCSLIIDPGEASQCFGSYCNFSWTFENANPSSSNLANPTTTFISIASSTITLTITDSQGYQCSTSSTIRTTFPLPKWREISSDFLERKNLFTFINFKTNILKNLTLMNILFLK